MMTTSQLLIQWYEEVWNNGNEAFIDELMDRHVIIHGLDPAGTGEGKDHFKIYFQNFRQSFPDIKINVQPLVHDKETAAVYCLVSGRNSDRKEVSFSGLSVVKFKNGKIIEAWNNFDFLKMYQQLGHMILQQIE